MNYINSIGIHCLSYKNLNFLPDAINSVFMQDLTGLPIVSLYIVDDCSSDFDYDMISAIVSDARDRFKSNANLNVSIYKNEENLGTVGSFNQSLFRTKDDLIIPLAADDALDSIESLKLIYQAFLEKKSLIVSAKRRLCDEQLKSVGEVLPVKSHIKYFSEKRQLHLLNYLITRGNFISGACTYYHRELFKQMGYFDSRFRLLEDYPLYLKVLLRGIRIDFLNQITVSYRLGGVSTASGTVSPIFQKDMIVLYEDLLENKAITCRQKRFIAFRLNLLNQNICRMMNTLIYFDIVFLLFYEKKISQKILDKTISKLLKLLQTANIRKLI